MNQFQIIRERLGVTQAAIADAIGVTQGNVSHYEKGQTVPPDVARRLIEYAEKLGHAITFNDVYGMDQVAHHESIEEATRKRNGGIRTHGDHHDRDNISK
ncbi:helix-turn-helix domain-containing protein [Undibacterium arcticum]|uniref:Helix-turn-helix domain-containing protein n=1 Tax=Undibacterium arcticum TaxID=1762892 RepID=A0ABV7EXB1_9BURK